jgi:hypothetical protein
VVWCRGKRAALITLAKESGSKYSPNFSKKRKTLVPGWRSEYYISYNSPHSATYRRKLVTILVLNASSTKQLADDLEKTRRVQSLNSEYKTTISKQGSHIKQLKAQNNKLKGRRLQQEALNKENAPLC